jgi:hypothetical protein
VLRFSPLFADCSANQGGGCYVNTKTNDSVYLKNILFPLIGVTLTSHEHHRGASFWTLRRSTAAAIERLWTVTGRYFTTHICLICELVTITLDALNVH